MHSVVYVKMVLSRALAAISLVSVAAATPLQLQDRAASPCAQVALAAGAQPVNVMPTVDAKLAYDCITSVPLHKSAALKLLDSVKPYFKWQSTTAWLKNPPKEYVDKIQSPVDVWGGLSQIENKVQSGQYANEFEVSMAIGSG